jgi:ubiquinone/menaquinone biosynthesis C-methylase UbiE
MSQWTDLWRDFVTNTSYKHILRDENVSEDQFWKSYGVYDESLQHSGYPGEVLTRIVSFIPIGSTFLDIGAGTGAFALPISRKTKRTIAIDPSKYQLEILTQKARREGLTNISTIEKEWNEDAFLGILSEYGQVDYSLAAYSLFDEDIEGFLGKMLDVSKKGVFIVFRAGETEALTEFAYGPRPETDYLCLYHILKEMGHQFDVAIFTRKYFLPLDLVFRQYRYCKRRPEEFAAYLKANKRLQERKDGNFASFSAKDALLYLIC